MASFNLLTKILVIRLKKKIMLSIQKGFLYLWGKEHNNSFHFHSENYHFLERWFFFN